jgi:two-component system sensor histidine kinase/response regulator
VDKGVILVVEDDSNLRSGICDILELQDYAVLAAENGAIALALLQAQEKLPDLILSDIMMPEVNGYEFFDEVRKDIRFAAIPFIFLTARGEKSDVRLGKSMGADDYVIKPFSAEDLIIAIDSKLRRHQQLDNIHKAEIGDVKQSILTILNHEFRTPLTYIVAYADLLNQDTETLNPTEMNEFLGVMSQGAERLRRLVENFIVLVELQTGEGAKAFAARRTMMNNPIAILSDAMAQTELFAKRKGITIRLEFGDEIWPTVIVDTAYLKLALTCLIENAIKFSDQPGKTVTVSAANNENGLSISVLDQGRGISQNEHQRIFEPFYQIDRSTYEDQGAGVGLAIVKHVADLHSAEITVESAVNEGSCFTLWIPADA